MQDEKNNENTVNENTVNGNPPLSKEVRVNIESLMALEKLPKFYANGFSVGNSLSDATLVAQLGLTPVALITMSFTGMKSLYNALGQTIKSIEKGLGNPLLDNRERAESWKENLKKTD